MPWWVKKNSVIIVNENCKIIETALKRKLVTFHFINLIIVRTGCFLVLIEKA